MKNALTLISAVFAALAATPGKSRTKELSDSFSGYASITGTVSDRISGGTFRQLNQRQRRKLQRQVPQLRKK